MFGIKHHFEIVIDGKHRQLCEYYKDVLDAAEVWFRPTFRPLEIKVYTRTTPDSPAKKELALDWVYMHTLTNMRDVERERKKLQEAYERDKWR